MVTALPRAGRLVPVTLLLLAGPLAAASDGRALPGAPLTAGLVSCEPDEPDDPRVVVIEGPDVYTTAQSFDDLDSLTVRGITFTDIVGPALRITDVDEVLVEDCTFTRIANDGGDAAITGRANGTVTLRDLVMTDITGHAIKLPDSSDDNAANRTQRIDIDGVTISGLHRVDGIEGSSNAIALSAADFVTVTDSHISDVPDWGIKLGHEVAYTGLHLGEDGEVVIAGNDIGHVMGDGILAVDGSYNVHILGNQIHDIATDFIGARPSNGDHGIYFQCNVGGRIEDNHIWNVLDYVDGDPSLPVGLGISYRSGDLVIARNVVHDTSKNGIAYFSDHPGSGTARVESNLVYDTGRGGIYLSGALGGSANPTRAEVDRHEIYANTVYMDSTEGGWSNLAPLGWYNLSEPCQIDARGNLLVLDNGDSDPAHYVLDGASAPSTAVPLEEWPGQEGQVAIAEDLQVPLEAPLATVFVDPAGRDLRPTVGSPAIDGAPSLTGVVLTDVGGAARAGAVDVGAWEASSP